MFESVLGTFLTNALTVLENSYCSILEIKALGLCDFGLRQFQTSWRKEFPRVFSRREVNGGREKIQIRAV